MIPSSRCLGVAICLSLPYSAGFAESADIIAAVTSASGKVSVVRKASKEPIEGLAGMALKSGDQLILGSKASAAVLYTTGIVKKVTGPAVYVVEVPRDKPKLVEIGKRLWAGVSRKFKTVLRGDAYGWGPAEAGIIRGNDQPYAPPLTPLRPRSGLGEKDLQPDRIPPEDLVFEWVPLSREAKVRYEIEVRVNDEAPVVMAPRNVERITDALGVGIMRGQLPADTCEPGKEYVWQVVAHTRTSTQRSQSTSFTVLAKEAWETTLEAAGLLRDEPITLAAYYEQEGCFSLAREQYHRALEQDKTSAATYLLLADLYYTLGVPGLADAAHEQAQRVQKKVKSETGRTQ